MLGRDFNSRGMETCRGSIPPLRRFLMLVWGPRHRPAGENQLPPQGAPPHRQHGVAASGQRARRVRAGGEARHSRFPVGFPGARRPEARHSRWRPRVQVAATAMDRVICCQTNHIPSRICTITHLCILSTRCTSYLQSLTQIRNYTKGNRYAKVGSLAHF